ncbi:MAG TPA: hypothetical protein VGJ49_06125 [Gaiellaceae bacterium]|jgi:hypothetical protein
MSWRELEGKKVARVQPVDQNEVVLELEDGQLVKISAKHPPNSPEAEAELVVEIKKAKK